MLNTDTVNTDNNKNVNKNVIELIYNSHLFKIP